MKKKQYCRVQKPNFFKTKKNTKRSGFPIHFQVRRRFCQLQYGTHIMGYSASKNYPLARFRTFVTTDLYIIGRPLLSFYKMDQAP